MKETKVPLIQVLIVALLAAALVACTAAYAAPQAAPLTSSQVARTITVIGVGEVSLAPDVAEINVGAEAFANSVGEAKGQVDEKIEAVLAALKALGIAEKDIQTSQLDIYYESEPYPVMMSEPMPDSENQGGYRVSNMLRVTVRNIEQVDDVLDAAVEAGANRVYGVSFTVSDRELWESSARESAVADARARAEELAQLSNVQLGEILSVSEVIGGAPVQMAYAMERAGGGGIVPGEMEFSTQIQVTFAIQ